MNKIYLGTIFLLFLLSGLKDVKAQIAFSPSFVFINENSGVGDLTISNNADRAYEISISFAFGYPGGDQDGKIVMNYDDPAAYRQFALDSMVRAFPRNFVLTAGTQRTVRIQVIPGERRKEGFFFTRIKILARPQAGEIAKAVTENVSTQLMINLEQITGVFYHRGAVSTGLEVQKVDVRQADSVLQIRPHLHRTGNAPFIGSMFAKLKDHKGNVLAEAQSTATAYFDVIRAMDLKITGIPAGTYSLELSFETRRNDMDPKDLVQSPPIVHEEQVILK